jgi:hypothetical protein
MNMEIFIALAISLFLTIILETGFFLLIGKRNKKDLLLVVMVNILTNPVVVLSYWLVALYTNWGLLWVKAALELLAISVEGLYYKKYAQELRRPFLFSLAANAVSFGIGEILQIIL